MYTEEVALNTLRFFKSGSMMFRSLADHQANPIESADFAKAQRFLVELHKAYDKQENLPYRNGSNLDNAANFVISVLDEKNIHPEASIQDICVSSVELFLLNLCDYICKVINLTEAESPEQSQGPLRHTQLGLITDYMVFLEKVFANSYARGTGNDRHRFLTELRKQIDNAIPELDLIKV